METYLSTKLAKDSISKYLKFGRKIDKEVNRIDDIEDDSMNKPVRIEKLYRATEHNFSIKYNQNTIFLYLFSENKYFIMLNNN